MRALGRRHVRACAYAPSCVCPRLCACARVCACAPSCVCVRACARAPSCVCVCLCAIVCICVRAHACACMPSCLCVRLYAIMRVCARASHTCVRIVGAQARALAPASWQRNQGCSALPSPARSHVDSGVQGSLGACVAVRQEVTFRDRRVLLLRPCRHGVVGRLLLLRGRHSVAQRGGTTTR